MTNNVNSYHDNFMRRLELSIEQADKLYKLRKKNVNPLGEGSRAGENEVQGDGGQNNLNTKTLVEKKEFNEVQDKDFSYDEFLQLLKLNEAHALRVRRKQEKRRAEVAAQQSEQERKAHQVAEQKEELAKEEHVAHEAAHEAEFAEELELHAGHEVESHALHKQYEQMLEGLQLEYENKKQQIEKQYELVKEAILEANLKRVEQKELEEKLEALQREYENKKLQAEKQKVMQEEATFEANLRLQHALEGAEEEDKKALEEAYEAQQEIEEHFNPTPFHPTPTYVPGSHGGNGGGEE